MSILPILQKIPLFQKLDEKMHQKIIENIKLNYFPSQYFLFNEGDPGERMYILKRGMVKIFHPQPDGSQEEIAILGPNDFFGEMALIEDKPRNASAVTLEETEIFVLEKKDFYELVTKNPDLAGKLSREFLERVKKSQS